MSATTNKIRQIFNLFLILILIAVAAGAAVWFLTAPEQRGLTFWVSIGMVFFSALLTALFASGIATRSNAGKKTPHSFALLFLVSVYVIFTIAMAIMNSYMNFTVTNLFLYHIAGGVVFLIPTALINMAALKLSGSDRKDVIKTRQNLTELSNDVTYLAEDIAKAMPQAAECLRSLKSLADDLNYAEPNPAPNKYDEELSRIIKDLLSSADVLLSSSQYDRDAQLENVQNACILAKRTLQTRNEALLRAKQGR